MQRKVTYSSEWAKLSAQLKRKHPLCLDPLALHPKQLKQSEEVHHSIPLKFAKELELEPSNLIPVCKDCHQALERLVGKGIILSPAFIKYCKKKLDTPKEEGIEDSCAKDDSPQSLTNTTLQEHSPQSRITIGIEDHEQLPAKADSISDLTTEKKGGVAAIPDGHWVEQQTASLPPCISGKGGGGVPYHTLALSKFKLIEIDRPTCCRLSSREVFCKGMLAKKTTFCPRCIARKDN